MFFTLKDFLFFSFFSIVCNYVHFDKFLDFRYAYIHFTYAIAHLYNFVK